MSVTLLTACAIQNAAYADDPAACPPGIGFVERYDYSTIQGWLYRDEKRERVGFVAQGTNERRDWLRNVDFRTVEVDGHELHRGWWTGADPLSDYCARHGVQEVQGHSKAGSETEHVAWRLDVLLHDGRPTVHCLPISGGQPWHGTPPRIKALRLWNPGDPVPHMPPLPNWHTAAVGVSLAWEPLTRKGRHRMGPVREALLRNEFGIWQYAIADAGPPAGVPSTVAPGVERRDSRARPELPASAQAAAILGDAA